MHSQQSKSYAFLILVIALTALSAFGFKSRDFQYGLDIKGGSRLTYKIKFDKDKEAEQRKNLTTIRQQVQKRLEARVASGLGVVEGSVVAKGEDEFVVEIPSLRNIEQARQILSSTAKLIAYNAKNVDSPTKNYLEYESAGTKSDKVGTYETFTKKSTKQTLEPGMPEYSRMIEGWEKILEGDDLAKADYKVQGNGIYQPEFFFSPSGAKKMEDFTRRTNQANLAFVLDNRVLSLAPVKANTTLTSEAFIDGKFDITYVKQLSELLNAGALPVQLEETSSAVVDPTIGEIALHQIVQAGLVAFGLISLFMLVYYVFPGLVAIVALTLYVLFTLTVMKLIGATFSLAAIAGFILSVGMAVDANILVFERLKEEMREGRSLMSAVELGFKRAFPAIADSNASTIIVSLVLAYFGSGAVKGFATTLIIGVAISFFTAVTVTRSLLVFLVGSGLGTNPKAYGLTRSWFGEKYEQQAMENPMHVIRKTKTWFMISLATIIPGVIFIGLGGIKPNVEFRGGLEVEFTKPAGYSLSNEQIEKNLIAAGYKGPIIKNYTAGSNHVAAITVDNKIAGAKPDAVTHSELAAACQVPAEAVNVSFVGPSIQQETINNAIMGVLISCALLILWLAIRFGLSLGSVVNGVKFGASAVLALLHDVLVVLGIAAIVGYFLKWEISSLFVTGMLTVIGFSMHDTIIIFDRIRENLRHPQQHESFEHLCDRSVSQSFGRSINTSSTVVATLLILIFMGTPTIDLKFFCVTMLTGIISGTYSSIFNATPILWLWDKAVGRTKGEDKTLIAQAIRESARLRTQVVVQGASGAPGAPAAPGSYGTVRRRRSVKDSATRKIDE